MYPVGTTIILWTVTDINGNIATCTQSITVNDNEQPVITCPADVVMDSDAGLCSAFVAIAPIAITDNCGVASIENDYNNTDDATDTYPVGITTITWTVTDIHGNVSTCVQTVEIIDNELPVITCPMDITQTADAALCSAVVTIDAPATSDNCAVASVINDYNNTANASGVYPVGTTTILWTVTDIHGNADTCSMIVTVTDNELPTITCPADITQTADAGVCEAFVNVAVPVNADNCVVASIINDYNNTANASDVYPVGTTTVMWTVTDIHGNFTTCSMDITVNDNEQPAITCPANITVNNDFGSCDAMVTVPAIVATDNCAIATITNDYNNTDDASGTYNVGTTTVIWTVTDIHGNVSTCTQQITVVDPELPVITCPADINQTADAGTCEAMVIVTAPVVSDNCTIASIMNDYTLSFDASSVYPVGTTLVTWMVTDSYGNAATCTMNIVVTDDELPVITCPADINQTADAGVCQAMVTVPAPVVIDNCGIATVINDFNGTENASGVYLVGTTIVEWTITDIHGNVSICTMNVTITDNEQPAITCPANITVNNDVAVCEAIVTVPAIVANDNCAVAAITNDYNNTVDASGVYPVGPTTILWTVTDVHGNVSTCTQIITVVDNEQPVINCPADTIVGNTVSLCTSAVIMDAPIVSDNCGIATVLNDYNDTDNGSGIYPVGSTTVVWTATDIHGNSNTCIVIVTVEDVEIPSIVCPQTITGESQAGSCDADMTIPTPTTDDNCGVASVINDYNGTNNASGIYPAGTTIVVWTVTDIHGNINSCMQEIVVNDTQSPIANSCGYTIEVNNDPQECGAIVTYDMPTAIDNCTTVNTTLISGPASGTFFPVGITEVIVEFTDVAGNATQCNFFVNVIDNEMPTVVCTEDITMNNDLGVCGAMVNYSAPTFQDNCGNQSGTTELIAGLGTGEVFPTGTTIVTYQITDAMGNASTCSFNVTIVDIEAPVIECSNDIITQDPIVDYALPNVTDNCSATLTLIDGLESGDVFPHGYTSITYAAIDPSGNADTCSFQVLVNNPPTAVLDDGAFAENDNNILINLIGNDYDIDGDSIFITGIWGGNGVSTLNANGSLSYSINTQDWCGMDTIYYTLCDSYNACDTGLIIINVECYFFVIIPQGFSPNGDGVNDTFEIIGIEDYPNNHLSVFNRWGHKVYERQAYDNSWNGTSESPLTIGNGMLPKGTYYYALDLGDGTKLMKGYVFLNR